MYKIGNLCNFIQFLRVQLINPLPHRDAFNTFANRADPDQAAFATRTKYVSGRMFKPNK